MIKEQQMCPNCKKNMPTNSIFCPHCGLKLKKSIQSKNLTRICKKCGTQINTLKLTYCPLCLTSLENIGTQKK